MPLMISWPGHFSADVVSDALVELMDLVPTFYDVLEMEMPYWMQGKSLLPVLKGETERHRDFVRTEFYGAIAYPDQTHATMYRDERWKLVCYHGKDVCELYDLENDPWEHRDLSKDPDYQGVKWELMQKSFDATALAYAKGAPRIAPY